MFIHSSLSRQVQRCRCQLKASLSAPHLPQTAVILCFSFPFPLALLPGFHAFSRQAYISPILLHFHFIYGCLNSLNALLLSLSRKIIFLAGGMSPYTGLLHTDHQPTAHVQQPSGCPPQSQPTNSTDHRPNPGRPPLPRVVVVSIFHTFESSIAYPASGPLQGCILTEVHRPRYYLNARACRRGIWTSPTE